MKSVAIVGAGAAGCFCAVALKRACPELKVTIYEAGGKPLAKVAITGGGRCNLTNTFALIDRLDEAYPRGAQLLKRAFNVFSPEQTRKWFTSEGISLVAQQDQCIFPESQDAMQIVRCLERLMRSLGVEIKCNSPVASVESLTEDIVVVTAGGSNASVLQRLLPSDIEITPTVPSLFTLKIPCDELKALMGTVVENVVLSIPGTKFRSEGTLLITDWGISGPATLKLSSYAARHLAECQYCSSVLINWMGSGQDEVREWIASNASEAKLVCSIHPSALTSRLWKYLLGRAGIREDLRWAELGGKSLNKLVECLCADCYEIRGRAKFKDEFVTCGGVALSEVNLSTLESRKHPGLYFAGEVLDVDAITGGFNLQAAWSTGFVVAESIAASIDSTLRRL